MYHNIRAQPPSPISMLWLSFFLFPHESPICVLGLPNAVGTNIEYGGAGEKCLKACSVFIKFFPAAWLARCLNAKGVINKSRVDIIWGFLLGPTWFIWFKCVIHAIVNMFRYRISITLCQSLESMWYVPWTVVNRGELWWSVPWTVGFYTWTVVNR